jgi:dTDP-L-rhamnose 4-epimerase
VLITGGAGFIGSHLADALLARGDRVRALDVLDPQVHGASGRPAYLDPEVELELGDVRDEQAIARALDGVDAVFHFAACVGVGQSMYAVSRYTAVNDVGTAVLLEGLMRRPVERLVVASSMSIYGEGLYLRADDGRPATVEGRPLEQLRAAAWDPVSEDGVPLVPAPTPESKQPSLQSVYALSKYDQERLCLMLGQAYGIPTVALRFFNVYGPRQALSNPYTGVLAIFASRLLNDKPPLVFEDGRQQRDFVHVRDVAQACLRALDAPGAVGGVFNVASGAAVTVCEVAERVARALGRTPATDITGRYRVGDVRHCIADISRARTVLGYEPMVAFDTGLAELADWLAGQRPEDRVAEAQAELAVRGLTA